MTYEFKLTVKERKDWKLHPVMDSKPIIFLHKIPIEKTKKFWDELKEGMIYATRCKGCGKVYFPPQSFCTQCYGINMEWIKLEGKGILETYTKVLVKPYGFTDFDDYIIGVARLDEGVRVLAWVTDCSDDKLKVGIRIKLSVKKYDDGYKYVMTCV